MSEILVNLLTQSANTSVDQFPVNTLLENFDIEAGIFNSLLEKFNLPTLLDEANEDLNIELTDQILPPTLTSTGISTEAISILLTEERLSSSSNITTSSPILMNKASFDIEEYAIGDLNSDAATELSLAEKILFKEDSSQQLQPFFNSKEPILLQKELVLAEYLPISEEVEGNSSELLSKGNLFLQATKNEKLKTIESDPSYKFIATSNNIENIPQKIVQPVDQFSYNGNSDSEILGEAELNLLEGEISLQEDQASNEEMSSVFKHGSPPKLDFASSIKQYTKAESLYEPHRVLDQIKVYLHKLSPESNKIEIQLQPAELGKIQVNVHFEQNEIKEITLNCDKHETYNLLQKEIEHLKVALHEFGFETNNTNLNFSFDQQKNQQKEDQQSPSNTEFKTKIAEISKNFFDYVYDNTIGIDISV